MAIYTKDGEFVRRTELNKRVDLGIRGMTVSMEGHIVVAVEDYSVYAKVIVL